MCWIRIILNNRITFLYSCSILDPKVDSFKPIMSEIYWNILFLLVYFLMVLLKGLNFWMINIYKRLANIKFTWRIFNLHLNILIYKIIYLLLNLTWMLSIIARWNRWPFQCWLIRTLLLSPLELVKDFIKIISDFRKVLSFVRTHHSILR